MKRSLASRFVFAFLLATTIMFLSPALRPSAFSASAQSPPFIGNMGVFNQLGGGWGPYPEGQFCGLFHMFFENQPGFPGFHEFKGLTMPDGTYTLKFRLTTGGNNSTPFRLVMEFNGCCHTPFHIDAQSDPSIPGQITSHTIAGTMTTITLTNFTIIDSEAPGDNGDLVGACFPSPDGFEDSIGEFTLVVTTAPTIQVLPAVKDSFLRQGANDTNEGANERLRLQSSGHNRVVVAFDMSGISTQGLTSATLVLNIAENSDNWGNDGGRLVDAQRLLVDWTEGNGRNDVMVPGVQNFRGTGEGVTWHCAKDADISNQKPDGLLWDGGTFASATAQGALHSNGLLGEVSWDVTSDVLAGTTNGWLIKKREEGQPGQVRYYSREGASRAGDLNLTPRLVLVYQQ